nr:MAG: hypothetical protein DIU62_01210 [Pseudomonadota bacterium]
MLIPSSAPDAGRRRMLQYLAAGPVLFAAGPLVRAHVPVPGAPDSPRVLSMLNTHTGERIRACYFEAGNYQPDVLGEFDHVLRDHRSGEVARMDPRLFDQLHALAALAGCKAHYEIISGYRSPATNEKLRKASTGVATRSLHMEGRAIDVRLPGCPTSHLRDLALQLRAGGVGYYARSDFVHLDTGRVRSWTG